MISLSGKTAPRAEYLGFKLYQGDGPVPETVTMEIETFNKLAGVACVTWTATSLGQRATQQLVAPLVARR